MNIHEYQAKKILQDYGIQIPKGGVAYTALEAKRQALKASKKGPWMLKSQIQSGARSHGSFLEPRAGSKGGIRRIKLSTDIEKEADKMLGSTLVTSQTGPKGKFVSRIYVEEFIEIEKIFYAGLVIDRMSSSITLLVAETKNKTIEGVALSHPEKILKLPLDFKKGINIAQVREVIDFLKLSPKVEENLKSLIKALFKIFIDYDASMIEINPVGVLKNRLIALDAKVSFDDNALYRHPKLLSLVDEYETEERELAANKHGFQYAAFEGNIGCIVNGDGLALACMDLISAKNNGTACFINVKGGVDKDKIAAGIKIIMTNPRVEGILINILGGFLRCNLIADGIISAASEVGLNVPLVVRFEGTNKEDAKDILNHSKLPIIIAENMEESVNKIIKAMEESE